MKRFIAIYIGTQAAIDDWMRLSEDKRKELQSEGMKVWAAWGTKHAAAIVDMGSPLGKTKRVSSQGISDIKNTLTGYTIVQAQSHEAAAKMFENHPHFTNFPGASVEIMECLPMPGM